MNGKVRYRVLYGRKILWRLLLMGFLSGIVGRLAVFLHVVTAVRIPAPARLAVIYVLVTPGIAGIFVALLFPLWLAHVKIRFLFLHAVAFWIIIPSFLWLMQAVVITGNPGYVLRMMSHYPRHIFVLAGFAVSGICFYLAGRMTGFDKQVQMLNKAEQGGG